jgi:hypothetical protein
MHPVDPFPPSNVRKKKIKNVNISMPPFPFKSLEKEKENPRPPSHLRVKKSNKKLTNENK